MELKYIIWQDMDGCITDFQGSSHALFGEEFDPIEPKISLEKKYETLQRVPTFWSRMPWMSDGRMLWDYIHRHDPHILSAYALWDYHSCLIGKREWIYNNLPTVKQDKIHLVNRREKRQFALPSGPNTLHI